MSGCYGGSREDRYFEDKLLKYLDDNDECPECGEIDCDKVCYDCYAHECECEEDEDENYN